MLPLIRLTFPRIQIRAAMLIFLLERFPHLGYKIEWEAMLK